MSPEAGYPHESRRCHIISVAGTAPIRNGETTCVGDVYGQTRYCLELSVQAVEEAGGRPTDIIGTRIMLTDMSCWEEAAKAHGELFSTTKPACTFVEVSRFIDPAWLVETEIDCVVGQV